MSPAGRSSARWAWAEVDLDAIRHNVGVIQAAVGTSAVWAVVKADAYGHGAVSVARAALEAGAAGLCVALVQEGAELRRAGIGAPILVLSEQPAEQHAAIIENRLIPTLSSLGSVESAATAAAAMGQVRVHDVQIKVDTGMNRAGAAPGDVVAIADAIAASGQLRLQGVFTHLAMADQPGAAANDAQLDRFDDVLTVLQAAGHHPQFVHAANSAAALTIGRSRLDMVRVGIAMYGIQPGPGLSGLCRELRPAMSLHGLISRVHRVAAGDGISYGHRFIATRPSTIATVPIGYADGVPRRLFETGGEVLIHGRRMPIVGVVTMDQIMVDCTDLDDVSRNLPGVQVGDEVVLIGSQSGPAGFAASSESITAEEWAERLGTIGYEIVCGISSRIERSIT